jgi:hypothetical protein
MGRRPIGDRPMTGSDRRRKFEKIHYHDPIVQYQTTIEEQKLKIRQLEQSLAAIKAVQDNEPMKPLDRELIGQRYEELTAENFKLKQHNKQLLSENKRLRDRSKAD